MTEILKGKDCSLDDTITRFNNFFLDYEINIEEVSWTHPAPRIWSVHIRDQNYPKLFANGKGTSQKAALASAYGEFIERFVTQYFFSDLYWNTLGKQIDNIAWFHHPQEKWIPVDNEYPFSILSRSLERFYRQDGEVEFSMLLDRNIGHNGVCCIPFVRESDKKQLFIPQNILSNLYVSNGMSCGNSMREAKIQALAEIIERAIKIRIIKEEISLPNIPLDFLSQFPYLVQMIEVLEEQGVILIVKDASLGGVFPVVNVTLIDRKDGGVYCAFGAHPLFEVALERTLTELLQGRELDALHSFSIPRFDTDMISSIDNLEEHFIDSTGSISWNFFIQKSDYPFVPWGESNLHMDRQWKFLIELLHDQQYEVYIADYSFCGENVCRIIVPGFSEIYPVDDLFLNNSSSFLPLYSLLFRITSLSPDEAVEMLRIMDTLAFSGLDSLGDRLGIYFSDPFWQKLTIGQLRILLHIISGNLNQAYEEFFVQDNLSILWKGIFAYLEIKLFSSLSIVQQGYLQVFGQEIYNIVSTLIEKNDLAVLPIMDLTEHNRYIKKMFSWHKKAFR